MERSAHGITEAALALAATAHDEAVTQTRSDASDDTVVFAARGGAEEPAERIKLDPGALLAADGSIHMVDPRDGGWRDAAAVVDHRVRERVEQGREPAVSVERGRDDVGWERRVACRKRCDEGLVDRHV